MSASLDRATACLGTMADLGVIGKRLDVGCGIMKAHGKIVRGKCRVCRRKLVATIHDGSHPGPPRRLALRGAE